MGRRNAAGLNDPVNESQGGTGAVTFDQARTNMGVNPTFTSKTATYNAVVGDRGKYFHYTGAGGVDFTLDPAATLTSTWSCFLRNDAAGNITINPNGAELINGAATLAIEPDVCVEIFCSGTGFFTLGQATAVDGANTALSNLTTTSINQDLIPATSPTYFLGSPTKPWASVYTIGVLTATAGGSQSALAAYDTAALNYTNFFTVTAGNPPTGVIGSNVTGTTQILGTANTTLATTAFVAAAVTAGAGAPTDATYITQTPNASLSNEQAMSALATGIVKNTTATGVQSIAIPGTDYYAPGSTDVAVADGGTGRSVADAYAVICGGTTNTNPHQSIASVGSAGQVLTSNGPGALPSFQSNPSGTGGMVLIATATASNSASIDFTSGINSTYDQYQINFTDLIPVSNNVSLYMRFQSGGVFRSTAGDYAYAYSFFSTAAGGYNSTSATQIELASTGNRPLSNSTTKGASGTLFLGTPANTATHKRVWGTYTFWETLPLPCCLGGWLIGVTTAVTGFQFSVSSNNISSGTFQLYGIKKT